MKGRELRNWLEVCWSDGIYSSSIISGNSDRYPAKRTNHEVSRCVNAILGGADTRF